ENQGRFAKVHPWQRLEEVVHNRHGQVRQDRKGDPGFVDYKANHVFGACETSCSPTGRLRWLNPLVYSELSPRTGDTGKSYEASKAGALFKAHGPKLTPPRNGMRARFIAAQRRCTGCRRRLATSDVRPDLKAHGVTFMSASDSPRSSDFFDSAYGETPPWDIGEAQPDLIALFNEYPPASPVLDLGCGTGDLAIAWARRGLPVLGIDLAEAAIHQARAKAAAVPDVGRLTEFRVGDALHPAQFPDRSGRWSIAVSSTCSVRSTG